jgi:hypothetical protein
MAFPTSPTGGQTYTNNGVTYIYDAGMGVWDLQGSVSSASPVTSVAGRTGIVALTAADIAAGTFPGALTATSTLTVNGVVSAASSTASTSTATGALVVAGGVGIGGAVYIGGASTHTGTATFNGGISTTTITASGSLTVSTLSVSSGINSTTIGATTPSTGSFTTLAASGVTTIPYHFVNRSGVTASGISWYSTGYSAWAEYMAPAGGTGSGPSGTITAPTGTLVTSWGLRSFIENSAGYGWTWESGTSSQTGPAIMAELRSSDGTFRAAGHIWAMGSLGVGTTAATTTGQILATNSIVAYYSDERLKTKVGKIEKALDKIDELSGFLYTENDLAKSFGFNNSGVQVALSAQDVHRVQPEATSIAPFDRDDNGLSKSGENYLTVQYDRLIPLLVEGIKELRQELNNIKQQIK